MKNKTNLSEFEVLHFRSLVDIQVASFLMDREFFDHAIEQCHFGLEKIMKAALIKHGATPPQSGRDGHNLLKICNVKVSGRKILLRAIKSNALMLQNWEKVHGRWDTGLRYEMMRLERGDYEELFEAYRGLIGSVF